MEGVMGPIASDPTYYMQEFKYKDVTRYNSRGDVVQGCHAKMCADVCKHITKITDIDGGERNFFCVFVPVYNETAEQVMKTLLSVMENIDFMKHEVKYHGDKIGNMLKKESTEMEVVIVPVFDGMYEHQMSPSVRDWLAGDFPNILKDMPDGKGSENVRDLMSEEERRDDIEVRVANQRWWYYCLTNSDADVKKTKELDPEDIGRLSDSTLLKFVHGAQQDETPNSYLHFHMVPIIKRTNHRKHNSLHWFIEGICSGIDTNLIMLTECSTTFKTSCIAHLTYEMLTRRSEIIAVCGQMRVEKPSRTFHPCKHTKIPFFKHTNEHNEPGSLPCWKCYAAYYCSCAPMQAFETELIQLLNMPVFNIVEAVPVLYGPCTLMNWPKVKNLKVIEEYFDMMFDDTSLRFGAVRARRRRLPNIYLESEYSLLNPFDENEEGGDEMVYSIGGPQSQSQPPPSEMSPQLGAGRESVDVNYDDLYASNNDSTISYLNEGHLSGTHDIEKGGSKSLSATKKHKMKIGTTASAPISANDSKYYKLKLVEILMAQLRLAEDRMLSFVTVFCTGFGTRMVNSSVFYYEPEVTFDMILKQRRRWLNGMVLGFFFLFFSERASLHTEGGFLDTHKVFKSIKLVNALWALNILQGALSFFAPSMFLVSLYKSLTSILDPTYAMFYYTEFFQFSVPALYTSTLLLFYILWVVHVFHRHPSELYSTLMFWFSAAASVTITYALFFSQVDQDDNIAGSLLIFLIAFFAPLCFAVTQNLEVAYVYITNAPWFFFYVGFYMLFIPSYAFARLWDTRWGNRYTKGDRSLGTVRQDLLKSYVWWFNVLIVVVNIIITVFCCLDTKNVAVPVFGCLILLPVLLQFSGGVLYMYLVSPLKMMFGTRKDKDENYNALFEERFNARVKKKPKVRGEGEAPPTSRRDSSNTFIRRANSMDLSNNKKYSHTDELIEEEIDSDEEAELQKQMQQSLLSNLSKNSPNGQNLGSVRQKLQQDGSVDVVPGREGGTRNPTLGRVNSARNMTGMVRGKK